MFPIPHEQHRAEARTGRTADRPRFGVFGILLATLLWSFGASVARAPEAKAQSSVSAVEVDVDALVARARPSMLTVIAQRELATRPRGGQVTTKRTHSRMGSGVAVGTDEILTTASVVLGSNRIFVITANGLQVEAAIAGMDPIRNIALLRAPTLQLPAVRFATRPPQLGDWVVTLGSSYRAQPTQSVGHVSSRYREPRTSLLQLTNEVFPGNSGGAALNTRGELVGIVQGELGSPEAPGARRGSDIERRPGGMSFVIPSEDILPVHRSLLREGRVRLGYFGVSTRGAFVESESEPGVRIPIGAIVEGTQAGGPAEKLGLRKGDLVVAYDGERVEYSEQFARWVAATPPGTVVEVVWVRNEMRRSGRVAVGESRETIPSWMRADTGETPVASAGADPTRVRGLQDEIRRLNRELDRLRGQQDSVH